MRVIEPKAEISHVRRTLFALLAAATIAGAFFAPGAASTQAAAPAATPSPSKKDPCGDTKSKWAHLQCQEYNASAPGDEYFGRMKISYLGIDNTFKDGSISAGAYTTDQHVIAKLLFADEALQRWASKYPERPATAPNLLPRRASFPQGLHAAGARDGVALPSDSHQQVSANVFREKRESIGR